MLCSSTKGLGYSVFTAVSAFCNAGIDLLGEDSLAQYVADPIVNFTSVGLIIMSGLGFVVWWDIWDKIKRVIRGKLPVGRIFKNLRLHSKIVLMMTLILVVGGIRRERSGWHLCSSQLPQDQLDFSL